MKSGAMAMRKNLFHVPVGQMHEQVKAEYGIELNSKFCQFISLAVMDMFSWISPAGYDCHGFACVHAMGRKIHKTAGAARQIEYGAVCNGLQPAFQNAALLGVNVGAVRISESLLVVAAGEVIIIVNDRGMG
jgi:hypothetical protein